ncbi:uncharacterized protein TRIVIDRAFT_42157 [Trichoderma virens Gv29-8]|uniref:Protein kinase domain-containing protein n=1 Tax=Hypocrea virens (strain Gv29-8 / FGSC 10586) TaxID=413071 RepID=G9N8J0_HYPVG|nr:uncharacterized protein TRIVIDRAFT_42157 [Trichoderma virens Gv29-8]EHK17297.1 hypothetical protein TRIVIDRAFT_42157 [Trichoderma virens Gv29-8]
MDEELESEDPAFEQLYKHIDNLAPNVYAIHISPDGSLISTSTDPKDDETRCVYYPPLSTIQRPEHVKILLRSKLEELGRLGSNVDLVACPQSSDPSKRLIFKYYFLFQHLSFAWHEMNLWIRLPKHPNIVPFDSIVIDELEGRFVGFTTIYIPGGTLEENKARPFKLKWLHQLINVIDELNLNLGIAHQDIAPRNLLIDEATDSLMLFDFNFSARIGMPGYSEARNDIKGTLFTMYEIITRNDDLRAIRHEDQDVSVIEREDWAKHPDVLLDHPVSEFRRVLKEWCEKRRAGKQITTYKDATNFLDWPPVPDPPLSEIETHYVRKTVKEAKMLYDWKRTELKEQGKTILNWQRPPQRSNLGDPTGIE